MFVGTPVVTGDVGDRDTYQSEMVVLVEPGSATALSDGIVDALSLKISQTEQSKPMSNSWEFAVDEFVTHIERIIRLSRN
jgi:energy-converting hydrogenase Eha subunit A